METWAEEEEAITKKSRGNTWAEEEVVRAAAGERSQNVRVITLITFCHRGSHVCVACGRERPWSHRPRPDPSSCCLLTHRSCTAQMTFVRSCKSFSQNALNLTTNIRETSKKKKKKLSQQNLIFP